MAMKRANGSGSVYKMKHKKLRKPYRAVITLGYNSKGKAKRKTIGMFATQREAYEALTNYDTTAMQFHEVKDTTFAECWEWMLEEKIRKGVQVEKGNYNATKDKLAHLMNAPMKNIRLAHLQAVIDEYNTLGRTALAQIKSAMNGTFLAAIKNDVIDKNYASLVTLPPAVKSTKHKPFTAEELYHLWTLANNSLYAQCMVIYCYTGMRPGEVQSIKISDVNLKERYMIGGSKTTAGKNRIIPIADCIMPIIKEWYHLAQFDRNELLLPKEAPKHLAAKLNSYLSKEKINHLPHDGRHTCATMLAQANIPEVIIKQILGHAHSDITNQVYIHRDAKELVNAVNKLPTKDTLLNIVHNLETAL